MRRARDVLDQVERAALVLGNREDGRDLALGVIDVLQEWTIGKRAESLAKRFLKCKDPNGISAVPVARYQERFRRFMNTLL